MTDLKANLAIFRWPQLKLAPKTERYDLLDGMRGIASIIVLWLHIVCVCRIYVIPRHAFLAVDFFFCLSGFVIAHAYMSRPHEHRQVWPFLRRRAARLMPLAIFGALIGGCFLLLRSFVIGDVSPSAAIAATLLNAMLLPTGPLLPMYSEAFGVDPPLWSLLQEMLVSIAFALGLVRLRKMGLLSLICVAAYISAEVAHAAQSLDFGGMQVGVWCGWIRVLYPFACGVLIQRLPIIANRHGYLALPILAGLLLLPLHAVDIQLVSVFILFPLIVYIGAGTQINPCLARMCRVLGAISYPVYVVNYPVIRFVAMISDRWGIQSPALIATVAALSSLAVAIVAMRLVEPLIRDWLFSPNTTVTPHRKPQKTTETVHLAAP